MITAHVDIRDVQAGLRELKKRGHNLRPVFRDFRQVLADDLRSHFRRGEGPSGGWKPYAASTRERLMERSGYKFKRGKRKGMPTQRARKRIGNQLGRLRSAWDVTMTGSRLEFRSQVPWADVHQVGGVTARGGVIPARPFAWISEELVRDLGRRVASYLVKGW